MILLAFLAAWSAHAACRPSFPYKDGWLGADAAYSVGLPDGRSLWVFGDTYVGKPGAKDRRGAAMIANSVALSTCAPAGFEITYFWRQGAEPGPFFETGVPGVRYWPAGAFTDSGAAYVVLSRVRATGAGALDFRFEGTDLARLPLPSGGLPDRTVRISTLSADGRFAAAGAAVDGGVAYLFMAETAPGRRHAIHAATLAIGSTGPLDLAAAPLAFEPGSPEISVARHGGRWLAVYSADGLPSPGVVMREGVSPEGPWTKERTLFEHPPKRNGIFCYAGKEHPELGLRQLVVTYACNAMRLEDVATDMTLVRPEVRLVAP